MGNESRFEKVPFYVEKYNDAGLSSSLEPAFVIYKNACHLKFEWIAAYYHFKSIGMKVIWQLKVLARGLDTVL